MSALLFLVLRVVVFQESTICNPSPVYLNHVVFFTIRLVVSDLSFGPSAI